MKILRSLLILLFSLSLLAMIPANAFSVKSKERLKSEQGNSPIEIQAEKLRSENEGKKFIFSGNVLSTWGDLIINSDVLEVYSNPKSKAGRKKAADDAVQAGQDVDRVIAIGNVKIKKGDRRAKGDRAHFDNKKQVIVITGEPLATAWEGENIIRAKQMTFELEKDLFKAEGGRDGRVNVVLNPKNSPSEKKR